MIYTGDFLITMDGPPIRNGCLRIRGNRIIEVGRIGDILPERGEQVLDFPEAVLMPGLINCHCHLELGMARNLLSSGESFSMWVSRLRKFLSGMDSGDYVSAAQLGMLECLKTGTTTLVDVGNTGASLDILPSSPLRSIAYLELIGLDPERAANSLVTARKRIGARSQSSDGLFRPGLTCHAPYSCAPELLAGTGNCLESFGIPFSLHLSESIEEQLLFRDGKGALLDFCRRIHPGAHAGRFRSPIQYLEDLSLIPEASLMIHCNTANKEDFDLLKKHKASIVHCPKSRSFFNHPEFPYEACYNLELNVCLGTDSLASNDGYNMFDEMAEFKRVYPQVEGLDILKMATVNSARALGMDERLGCLKPGYLADFIALSLKHDPLGDLYEEIVNEEHEVILSVVNGEGIMI